MKITWYGHSAFKLATDKARILVDPFFTGNPKFPESDRDAVLADVTHIALTHGHGDHLGDTIAIAQQTGATVIANGDLCNWLSAKGVKSLDPGNTGGTVHHDGFSMTWVQAFHSSASVDDDGVAHSLGMPNGLVFHFEGGQSVYHMGDTDIFGDMALIQELHQPQIGLVPIGDRYTMGGAIAALSCTRYFNFDTIIPCHFGTFPGLDQTADSFLAAMDSSDKVKLAEIGVALEF
jgi:L-ascorbate metabolism protein UlaG (beta-lactamase superfamily)